MERLKPCPFCGKSVAVVTNVKETEECANFENDICPDYEKAGSCGMVTVVCNFGKGGCGSSSGWHENTGKAVAAWNRRI